MSDILQWTMKQVKRPITGVLHLGANSGQEAGAYDEAGLKAVWIEADPKLMEVLRTNIAPFPTQSAFQCLASDVDGQEVEFHIASNGGGSSSVLKPDAARFAKEWPEVKEVESVRLRTCRLDTFFAANQQVLRGVNLVLADVQGYELPVLRGLGSLLDGVDAVISELNWAAMYEGATTPQELERFLVSRGFRRAWLGLSDCQATGVWVRREAGLLRRIQMALTVRVYYCVARFGCVKLLRACGCLELARRIYCFLKNR